jgi:hypothetical protein
VQQRKFILVSSIRAVHQQDVRVRQQKFDLLLMGEEEVLDAIVIVLLDSKNLVCRR